MFGANSPGSFGGIRTDTWSWVLSAGSNSSSTPRIAPSWAMARTGGKAMP